MSKLYPEQGELPTKLAFDGVEQGSPEAVELRVRYGGAIRHFHAKARQARVASGSPSGHMHTVLPDGGRISYSYNEGQEVLRVQVAPVRLERPIAPRAQPHIVTPMDPVLAIDVLFDPKLYLAGDIYAYTVEESTEPVDSGPWWDQSKWSTFFSSGMGAAFFDLYGDYSDAGLYWIYGRYQDTTAEGMLVGAVFEGLVEKFDINDHDQAPKSSYVFFGAVREGDLIAETGYFIPSLGGGGGGGDGRLYTREKRSLFNVLTAVGAQGNPEPTDPKQAPYEAKVAGADTGSDDGKLLPAADLPRTVKTIDRTLVASDPTASAGYVGAGFVARPTVAPVAGFPVTETVIDIYLTSINVSKANQYPEGEGATWEDDHPSFTYDFDPEAALTIRCREFSDGMPGKVEVRTRTEQLVERFRATAPDTEPTEPELTPEVFEPSEPERTVVWHFAASTNWDDAGNDPAAPDRQDSTGKQMMGKQLGQLALTRAVRGPEEAPIARRLHTVVEWAGSVTTMTRVARVTWQPPAQLGGTGAVTIDPA